MRWILSFLLAFLISVPMSSDVQFATPANVQFSDYSDPVLAYYPLASDYLDHGSGGWHLILNGNPIPFVTITDLAMVSLNCAGNFDVVGGWYALPAGLVTRMQAASAITIAYDFLTPAGVPTWITGGNDTPYWNTTAQAAAILPQMAIYNNGYAIEQSSYDMDANIWRRYTFVYTSTSVSIYVGDGLVYSSANNGLPLALSNYNIGAFADGAAAKCVGYLARVAIYKVAKLPPYTSIP